MRSAARLCFRTLRLTIARTALEPPPIGFGLHKRGHDRETSSVPVLVSDRSPAVSPWSGTITLCVWEYQCGVPDRARLNAGALGGPDTVARVDSDRLVTDASPGSRPYWTDCSITCDPAASLDSAGASSLRGCSSSKGSGIPWLAAITLPPRPWHRCPSRPTTLLRRRRYGARDVG